MLTAVVQISKGKKIYQNVRETTHSVQIHVIFHVRKLIHILIYKSKEGILLIFF